MTICLSVSAGDICRTKNDFFSLLFLFLGEEKCEKEIKNDISSFLFSGSSIDVFSAAGKETRWFSFLFFFLKIPLFKGFFRTVAVLFSYKRAGGKVVFFHFVQGVRVQKKPHAAGIRSTRLRCLL